ncbi:unnamed protein product [Prorocentrum cordatum]|uniref:Uncharacterized protein n=1 Tax=Prorocentrum cordatum TaxID=2364126 RepID=A0ABN9SSW5_9DINO|nr:unnamed protein product [Polarella glacialis]
MVMGTRGNGQAPSATPRPPLSSWASSASAASSDAVELLPATYPSSAELAAERLSFSSYSSVSEPLSEDTHSSSMSGSGSMLARRTGATGLGAGFGAIGGRPLPTRAPLRGCTAGASGDAARGGSTCRPAAGGGQQPAATASSKRPRVPGRLGTGNGARAKSDRTLQPGPRDWRLASRGRPVKRAGVPPDSGPHCGQGRARPAMECEGSHCARFSRARAQCPSVLEPRI